MSHAKFIALDSADGAGKDLQTELLLESFQMAGIPCQTVHETKATPDGQRLYDLVTKQTWDPVTATWLFSAARNLCNETVVKPALAAGVWMVTNRSEAATEAYQGFGDNVDLEFIRKLQRLAAPIKPDLFLILDVPPEVGLARKSAQKGESNLDVFEARGTSLQAKVREGLLESARYHAPNAVIIDATQSKADVHRAILNTLNDRYGLALQPVI